jgi:hypothetical protein
MNSDEEEIQEVWEKGHVVSGIDPDRWRKDDCDAWIGRIEYGNRDSQYGWEIDHIDPDGGDDLSNKRPLQWENNLAKGDSKELKCVVSSSENKNVKLVS